MSAGRSTDQRDRLMELGRDLETAWNHTAASESLKKRILRCLLEEIVVDITDEPPEVQLTLHWSGGVHTRLRVTKNRTGQTRFQTDRQVTDLLPELACVCRDKDIASILNRLGLKTGTGRTWIASHVASLRSQWLIVSLGAEMVFGAELENVSTINTPCVRNRLGVKPYSAQAHSEYVTLQAAAPALGVSAGSIPRLLEIGVLPARQVVPCAPWLIRRTDLRLEDVQTAVTAIHAGRKVPRHAAGQQQFPFK